ncbi:TPA: hypothetical protein K8M77_000309 [Clostridium perfringens]|nr:hypothetical protein [Clostridium perfringens]
MSIVSLAEFMSALVGHQVYAINFPNYKKGDFLKLEITSGVMELGGVDDFNVQFMARASHPAKAEQMCLDVLDKLDKLTNKEFNDGKCQLILAQAEAPQPFYVGETEDGAFLMSVNFRLLTTTLT